MSFVKEPGLHVVNPKTHIQEIPVDKFINHLSSDSLGTEHKVNKYMLSRSIDSRQLRVTNEDGELVIQVNNDKLEFNIHSKVVVFNGEQIVSHRAIDLCESLVEEMIENHSIIFLQGKAYGAKVLEQPKSDLSNFC